MTWTSPGLTRRRRGKGFEYIDHRGRRVTDDSVLERIRSLAIPPAWTDVWICPHENGHIQAVGTDDAGRRQYLYHQAWRERRDQEKFERMLEFARCLPRLREVVDRDVAQNDLDRRKVLACAVRLLDRGYFRIGGERYAEETGSVGVATLRKDQVKVDGEEVVFHYTAKGGKERLQQLVDPDVAEAFADMKRRRTGGLELLAWREDGEWRDVKSADVNAYLKEASGFECSAKDFRTWHATVLAAVMLARAPEEAGTKTSRRRAVPQAVKNVSEFLGNTPTVCRKSYIDPRVVDRFNDGITIAGALEGVSVEEIVAGDPELQKEIEDAVLDLIENDGASRSARGSRTAGGVGTEAA